MLYCIFPSSKGSFLSLRGFISEYFILFIALFISHCLDHKSFILNNTVGQWESLTLAFLLQYYATLGMFLTLHISFKISLLMPRILVPLLEELHLGSSIILTVYFPAHHHRSAPNCLVPL